MKKILGGIVLLISICFVYNEAFAASQKEMCESSPIANQYWDPVIGGGSCRCIAPMMRDEETYQCISKDAYDKKHTWSGSGAVTSEKPAEKKVEIKDVAKPISSTSTPKESFEPFADNYKNISSDGEVTLSNPTLFNNIKIGATEAVFQEKLKAWEKSVSDADAKNLFKDGANKEEFKTKIQEEKNIKLQIAQAEKLLGLTHVRVLESTKTFKFENQSAEYKAYWKQPVDNNAFDDTTGATAFNAATANVSGLTAQIRDLKQKLQDNYPTDWKLKYLAVAEKPVREQGTGIINIFN
ncbi:MAG: hypothetical protein WCF92_00395 [bacterium]